MGQRINLLRRYPGSPGRMAERPSVSASDRRIAGHFGFDYFDGDRRHGYGGYDYHPKFWKDVVRDISDHYGLASAKRVLDIGCAKGFMLRDLQQLHPHLQVVGIDISKYALANAHPDVADCLIRASANCLPFPDKSFDLVISINTIHNLPYSEARQALSEMARVSRQDAFLMVDGWKTELQKRQLESWVLTAQTMLHENEWIALFAESRYVGDYWFWSP